jgi:hypothetical protein
MSNSFEADTDTDSDNEQKDEPFFRMVYEPTLPVAEIVNKKLARIFKVVETDEGWFYLYKHRERTPFAVVDPDGAVSVEPGGRNRFYLTSDPVTWKFKDLLRKPH